MSVESLDLADDLHVVVVRGKLGVDELHRLRVRLAQAGAQSSGLRVLVVLRDFAGWERSSGWSRIEDPAAQDPLLRRIAVVGEPQWRDEALLFMVSDLREVPIEYFAPSATDAALRWLIGA